MTDKRYLRELSSGSSRVRRKRIDEIKACIIDSFSELYFIRKGEERGLSQIFLSSTLKKFLETIFIDSTKIYLLEKSLEPIEIRIFLIIIISRNQNLFPSLISSYFNQKSLEFSRLKFESAPFLFASRY